MKRFFVLFFIFLAFQMATAQIPESFSYQAIVRNETGQPLGPQTVSFRISILEGSVAGSPVYTETHSASTNQFGMVTLAIGKGIPAYGVFSAIEWGASDYFLKVEIDPAGGNDFDEMGTTQLLSVPYSLYAKRAGNAFSGNYNDLTDKPDPTWIKTDDNIYFNSGIVGIGTNNPDESSILDIESDGKGILLPRLNDSQRDAIISPKEGLLIFNTTTKNFNVFRNGNWFEWEALNCVPQPTTANAGSDQVPSALTTSLSANVALTGSGNWSIVSGEGGVISDIDDPVSSFTGTLNSTYELRWTISNTCGASTDDVTISFIPDCSNGIQELDETDIDCGGSACPKCADGKNCLVNNDCISGVCVSGICQVPACDDGVKNAVETDIDCGGGTCPKCADLKHCNTAADCISGVCIGNICRVPACNDNVLNGSESGVDCGGETCLRCATGVTCNTNNDCQSLVCSGYPKVCQAPTCSDGVKNGTETDLDCGGGGCAKCTDGKTCTIGSRDCISGVCAGNICQVPACDDGVQNGVETDIDCGGTTCTKCADGKKCLVDADCQSGKCSSNLCAYTIKIDLNGGIRRWGDGTYATSAKAYRYPDPPYSYSGDTGDGIYRIWLGGNLVDVYCDMTTDGGGWTLVWSNLMSVSSGRPYIGISMNTTMTYLPSSLSDPNSTCTFTGLNYWSTLGAGGEILYKWSHNNTISNPSQAFKATIQPFSTSCDLVLSNYVQITGTQVAGMWSYHNGMKLTTGDADNDNSIANCSTAYSGTPFWYNSCWNGSITGYGESNAYTGAYWYGIELKDGLSDGTGRGNGWILLR